MVTKSRVAIIGAGVSGLAAAVRLASEPNIDLTIYEARQEPGGRTRSYVDTETGDTMDNGQHILASCYSATLAYLRMIGSESLVTQARSLAIEYWQSGQQFHLSLPRIPSPADLVIGILRTDLLSASEKLAAIRFGNAVRSHLRPADAASLTVRELLDTYRQPARVVERLWEPIVLATINARIEHASATIFLNVLSELFFGTTKGSALLVPSASLTNLLIRPALAQLKSANWKLGELVTEVQSGENCVVIRSASGTHDSDFLIRTDTTAVATYSSIVNAYFWLDRKVLDAPITGFLGTTLQWAFPKPSSYAEQLLALTVSAADPIINDSTDSIRDLLWHDLQSSVPESRGAKLLHYRIIKEKRATPLITPDVQRKRPRADSGPARVFLAGDYVQNGLPATIEGAVRNGFTAAELVLREAGPR